MVRPIAHFALWLVAALVAAVMTLAPASAHPGHDFAGHHAHVAAVQSAPAAPVAQVGKMVHAQLATGLSQAKFAVVVTAPADDPACAHCVGHNGCSCGNSGCCSAVIAVDRPHIPPFPLVTGSRSVMQSAAIIGVEPGSLLEPPNFLA